MIYYLVVAVYVLVCLLLLGSILLQQGRAGDIASAFGGGARSGATMLTRATTVLAVLFMVGSIALAIAWQKAPGSVVSGLKMPAAPTAPAKTPAVPAKK